MRRLIAGLFAVLLGSGVAHAQPPPPGPTPALDVYASPARLVKLADGRRIHLNCQGKGGPTVILTAGLGGWTDEQIKRAISQGISRDGRKLQPPMPFVYYARVNPSDLDALVAYLRTLPPLE